LRLALNPVAAAAVARMTIATLSTPREPRPL